ncbi:3-methylornithine--L-lysine ligase PylC [Desulfosporosinus sp. PR]|uniref:3-methylornithine--L-lysine ligase PylC n=1 Tax=Candidatus Desulfosporosinus nitrosoreducens TaxID=3401928 RepID=UPI0027FEF265|nr:3-methylornithine--L-lysine ligase PylC [Desulfosporosinus sp. PR]MDQ7093513.1 3-methylornithine--L-lysine ligase PylC [Desulfosporosinus sp. PR]
MRVAIVGGKLQGLEAAYLAKKAGWEVVLIDKNDRIPALELCDQFYAKDVTKIVEWLPILKGIDLIIPALENKEALNSLIRSAHYANVPLLFDGDAYEISSSKLVSNAMFARSGVPAPIPWPECGFPIIVKPSDSSGSEGVFKINSVQEFQCLFEKGLTDWVIEEYLEGQSYSLEVIGYAGVYKVLHITELEMDEVFDCKRVLGAPDLPGKLREEFEQLGLRLARTLNLNGIMDIETILHRDTLKVLEIDARLPSQTPITVYHATGVNMLEILGRAFVEKKPWADFQVQEKRGVVFEHIQVTGNKLEVVGEHVISEAGPLKLYTNFFGADEVLTDFTPGQTEWTATLIISAASRQEAWVKHCEVVQRICHELGIAQYLDRCPEQRISNLVNGTGS